MTAAGVTSDEGARERLDRWLRERFGDDAAVESLWLSNHQAIYDCDWEYGRCGARQHGGYWNAWIAVGGERRKVFWSPAKGRWLYGHYRRRTAGVAA